MQRRSSGDFELPIPAKEAIGFFTPEGERSWAPGWDPTYPAVEASENPGTVFVTRHGDAETVWIIDRIDRQEYTSAYSLVKTGHRAGTVRVRCTDNPEGGCRVDVEYVMTVLGSGSPEELDAFSDEHFAEMMIQWKTFVTAGITNENQT